MTNRDSIPATSAEKDGLALDVAQFVLDIVGIFEPTPFADGTNALISMGRGDWVGAGLSAVSILPYVGDFAKLGKIPKYARSINRALEVAAVDAKFADRIRPALVRLKGLLDDVPTSELPDALLAIRRKLDDFLKGAPPLPGPVRRVLDQLPGDLRAGFLKAMKQPPLKNPRKLRKHPGPVDEDAMLKELHGKGFVQVKKGSHTPGAGENSDIYLRRIVGDDGKQYFETVRVDRKFPGGASSQPGKSAGDVQRSDKAFRRTHNTVGSTSKKAGVAEGGRQTMTATGHRRMVDKLQAGAKKGEFSHWHHEKFVATPENLATYMQRPLKGTIKMDNVGQVVDPTLMGQGLTNRGKLKQSAAEAAKDRIDPTGAKRGSLPR